MEEKLEDILPNFKTVVMNSIIMSVTIIVYHNHGNRIDRATERIVRNSPTHIWSIDFQPSSRQFNREMKHFQQIVLKQLDIPVELGVGGRKSGSILYAIYKK